MITIRISLKIWKTKEKSQNKIKIIDFVDRKSEVLTNQKVKSLIDFYEDYSCSIRLLAI